MPERRTDGSKLRALREQAGLYQGQLATLVDCSKGHIRNVETQSGDRHKLSPPLAHRIARELSKSLGREVSVDEFTYEVIADAA